MKADHQPYVGLRPFQWEDEAIFFGREREARDLVGLIVSNRAVLLHSKPGAGKTSLINARVIPLLTQEGFEVLPVTRVSHATEKKLHDRNIRNIYVFNALTGLSQHRRSPMMLQDETFKEYLSMRARATDDLGDPLPITLVFDHFEELFTTYPERWEDRRGFFEQIGTALQEDRFLRVLFSMKEEYMGELEQHISLLPGRLMRRFRLEGLNKESALAAVRGPLDDTDRDFAPGVAEGLVKELLTTRVKTDLAISEIEAQFVDPVHLQIVCHRLWNSLDPSRRVITETELEEFGDVDRALHSFYETVVHTTVRSAGIKEGSLRRWFETALITPAGTRATVFRGREQTEKLPNAAIDELENQHIIRSELRGGQRWYELSHDRFINAIKESNRAWLLNLSGAEARLAHLEERAWAWMQSERDTADLLDQWELAETEQWLSLTGAKVAYSDALLAFLQESSLKIRSPLRNQKRQYRRMLFSFAIMMMLIITLFFFALYGQQRRIQTLKHVLEQQNTK